MARDAEAKGLTRLARQARDLSGRGDADRPDPLASLTGREREVVALIAEGRSNLDISRELFISLKTVKSHVSHVFTKLDATSRTQVALLVQRTGQPAGTDGPRPEFSPKPDDSRARDTDDRTRTTPSPELGGHLDQGVSMPFINVKLIEGVFDTDQKQQIVRQLTDTMVSIEGEAMRPVTWVVVEEVASGEWGIGGQPMTTGDVKALQGATT